MIILNLGCGTRTSSAPGIINIDWSIYLRIKKSKILTFLAQFVLGRDRQVKLQSLPKNIQVYDLRKGIPFKSDSADAVYHSHFLEHIPRNKVGRFFAEVRRVLKVGGIHRIVVPDLENLCRSYLNHCSICSSDPSRIQFHESYISNTIEQLVRKEPFMFQYQNPIQRLIEQVIIGNALQRGETHQWMYDRFSLQALLSKYGFKDIREQAYDQSAVPQWPMYGLDQDPSGEQYKKDSIYMEAVK